MRKKRNVFVADFETAVEEPTYVWGWGLVNIEELDGITFGSDIKSFFRACEQNSIVYFHNLGFDGTFILDYLLRKGFTHTKERVCRVGEFNSIISAQRMWYKIGINYEGKKIEFRDSLKKLPFTVERIGKSFLHEKEEKKGNIDYKAHREEGAPLTGEDKEYIGKDVIIIAKAIKYILDQGQTELTIGADALKRYKHIMGDSFKHLFPVLPSEIHLEIKSSYKGGWTYVKKDMQGKKIETPGCVYDVNSLYPDRMSSSECSYPVGNPVYFDGKYRKSERYPLYVTHFRAIFDLKDKHLPTIQIKGNPFFVANEYVEDSNGITELTLTKPDFELFQEHYNIHEIQYIDGYMFRAATGIFDDYILPIYEARQKAEGAEKELYKLLLNALYGKFAKSLDRSQIIPYFDEEKDVVRYNMVDKQTGPPLYIPVGSFITAYARLKTISTAQRMYDKFIYGDTDSLHILGDAPEWLEIHSKKLGAWKKENTFYRAKFVRPKRYIEIGEKETVLKCCGLSQKGKENVTWDNFVTGTVYTGNLKKKIVPGGSILLDGGFELK